MENNFWLGANELCIVYRNGKYHVIEEYENWESVYQGEYKKCLEYCKQREIDYLESILI